MRINQLPDDCLLYIFNLFNRFETLFNCSKVCERWKYLVRARLFNVAYLSDCSEKGQHPAAHTIYYKDKDELTRVEVSEWFPRLKIMRISEFYDLTFVSNLPVEGLILASSFETLEAFTLNNPLLKMLAINGFYNFFANDVQGPMINQLFVDCTVAEFANYAKHFPNLKRLHIEYTSMTIPGEKFYTGPVLEYLEILEMCFHGQMESTDYYGFSLADQCPALKSVFHFIQDHEACFVDTGIENHSLEDLVIQFQFPPSWTLLRQILKKYPNLKHLAIRVEHNTGISDENIPEILALLPNVALIDIRESKKVTEYATEYIDQYCKSNGRSISFYYRKRPKITKKWPHLSANSVQIGRGLDFMKYCFLRRFNELPCLLDPVE